MRLEKDSLGELEVPDEAYYGVQTVRCSGNYKIGNHTYNEFPEDEKEVSIEKEEPQEKIEVPLFEEKIKTNEAINENLVA